MIRTQVQLTEEQVRRLRRMAREQGISFAETVRRCLEEVLHDKGPDRRERYEAAAALIGRFTDRDGAQDVAEEHDRYLEEAYE